MTLEKCSDDKPAAGKRYDLEERTALFGEAIIDFLKRVPVNPITRRLIFCKIWNCHKVL